MFATSPAPLVPPSLTADVEYITPSLAAKLLETNIENRKPSAVLVRQYASDIKEGRWKLNGQAIQIDEAGRLIDGQHRLMAVIDAGTPVDMLVVRGVPRSSRDTIDTNKPRLAGDILQMFHIPNGMQAATLAKLILSYERGDRASLGHVAVISKSDVINRARTDRRIQTALNLAHSCSAVAKRGAVGFVRYIVPDGPESDEFFRRLADGANLDVGHPVLTLRNWWLKTGRQGHTRAGIEATMRAWCAYRDGRKLSMIKILGEFPLI
jgi:hypothetical protein